LPRRAALEQLRKRIREQNRTTWNETSSNGAPISEINELIDTSLLDSATITSGNELAEHLRNALATIDPRQAEVFCLACLDDCSYQEIAEQLQITVSNVGALLNRARAALREQLKAHNPKRESNFIDHG
jgi:RNA polymerase sigma factor (sigma-70 family)